MIAVFYVVVIEQILQGIYSLWQGLQWLAMARRHLRKSSTFYTPTVALFCPVKGLEPGLEQNLLSLTQFDYLRYEIFFVTASMDDPAVPLLGRIAAASKQPVHILHAGPPVDCGEKVNNLRVATERAGEQFEVFVFADSDGRPHRGWLTHLIAPLADKRVGAATTFRWLLPDRGGLSSAFVSAWNAPIATFLGEHNENFCWGGGTAIRQERFKEVHVRDAWEGSVSDDFSLTHALKAADYSIVFVPECVVPSPTHVDFKQFLEFISRQMIITRVYALKLWITAIAGHSLYCAAVLLGIGLWMRGFGIGVSSLNFLLLALIPPMLSALRGVQRLIAFVELLPECRKNLLDRAWIWTILAPLNPFFALYAAVRAGFTRKITWRGRKYELLSATQTRILAS